MYNVFVLKTSILYSQCIKNIEYMYCTSFPSLLSPVTHSGKVRYAGIQTPELLFDSLEGYTNEPLNLQ